MKKISVRNFMKNRKLRNSTICVNFFSKQKKRSERKCLLIYNNDKSPTFQAVRKTIRNH